MTIDIRRELVSNMPKSAKSVDETRSDKEAMTAAQSGSEGDGNKKRALKLRRRTRRVRFFGVSATVSGCFGQGFVYVKH
jgi:hypothetical protein